MTKRLISLLLCLLMLAASLPAAAEGGSLLDAVMADIEAAPQSKVASLDAYVANSYAFTMEGLAADQASARLAAAALLVPASDLLGLNITSPGYWNLYAGQGLDGGFQVIFFTWAEIRGYIHRINWTPGAAAAVYERTDIRSDTFSSNMLQNPSLYWGAWYFAFSGDTLGEEMAQCRARADELDATGANALRLGEIYIDAPEVGLYVIVQRPAVSGGSRVYEPLVYTLYNSREVICGSVESDEATVRIDAPAPGEYCVEVAVTDTVSGKRVTAWSRALTLRDAPETPLSVADAVFEISPDQRSVFINRPEITGGSGAFTIAYNIYDADSNPVNYFYSDERRVAATPGYEGLFNVFIVVTDTQTGESHTQNIGWHQLAGPETRLPLRVAPAAFEISEDTQSVFIDRPAITGGSGTVTIAYNIYDADSNPVNYFYSDAERVAATPGYAGHFNVFIVVTDTVTGESDIQNIGWTDLIGPDDGPVGATLVNGIYYGWYEDEETGRAGMAALDCVPELEKLEFADEVDGQPVTLIAPDAFSIMNDHAREICCELRLPAQLKWIGNSAFASQTSITGTIVFPQGLEEIGPGAFYDVSVHAIELPEGLKRIGGSAFHGSSLKGSLSFPASLEEIGGEAFRQCKGLTGTLLLPDGLQTLGEGAFTDCPGLTGLQLPQGGLLEEIGAYAFTGCTGLTGNLIIPEGVTVIGNNAFQRTTFDGTLTLPKTVTAIGDWAFSQCKTLKGSLSFPSALQTIGMYAFEECVSLTGGLILPDSMISIGSGAFRFCTGLNGQLHLPARLVKVPDFGFEGCTGLTGELVIPSTVTHIGSGAFENCSGFSGTLRLGSGVTAIGDSAFKNCSGLTGTLTFATDEHIGFNAFEGTGIRVVIRS